MSLMSFSYPEESRQARESYLQQRRGHITKAGNRRMRALLVEASWQLLRSGRPDTEALRAWANPIALRRGK